MLVSGAENLCLKVRFNLCIINYVFILSTAHYKRLICGKGARIRAVLGQQRFAGPAEGPYF